MKSEDSEGKLAHGIRGREGLAVVATTFGEKPRHHKISGDGRIRETGWSRRTRWDGPRHQVDAVVPKGGVTKDNGGGFGECGFISGTRGAASTSSALSIRYAWNLSMKCAA
jgi:hypothetical protein